MVHSLFHKKYLYPSFLAALHHACSNNNFEIVKLLLSHPKIDINLEDSI